MEFTRLMPRPGWHRIFLAVVLSLNVVTVVLAAQRIWLLNQDAQLIHGLAHDPDRDWSPRLLSLADREQLNSALGLSLLAGMYLALGIWIRRLGTLFEDRTWARRRPAFVAWLVSTWLLVVIPFSENARAGRPRAGSATSEFIALDHRLMWMAGIRFVTAIFVGWVAIDVFQAADRHFTAPQPLQKPDERPRTW